MRTLHYSVVVRRELSKKSKVLNFWNSLCSFSPPASLYSLESAMTERVRSQMLASKIRFLQKIRGITWLTRCTSLEIRKSLELLLLQIERSQLRWFGHVNRIPQEKLPKQALLAKANGEKTVGRPRTIVDESILHWGSWVELHGTSPKQNDGGDGRPWSVVA